MYELLSDAAGHDLIKDYTRLDRIADKVNDKRFLAQFMAVKQQNKERLAEYVWRTQNVRLNPNSVFDVQAKRLHEYKRQLLKALAHPLALQQNVRRPACSTCPRPLPSLFAAKASPGYVRAKSIIRLINAVAALVNGDPRVKGRMQVLFLENYGVSLAELLMPATDLSEQISTAGYEASGTGNMKFMLSGAVTLGTMDGANVEIYERAGKDNIFIFGADAEEITRIQHENSYHPAEYFAKDADIRAALTMLTDGSLAAREISRICTMPC